MDGADENAGDGAVRYAAMFCAPFAALEGMASAFHQNAFGAVLSGLLIAIWLSVLLRCEATP